ncbi:MAG: ATP-binding protein [Actinomycetota bacterium]|nr:ATP-binding protein [Actinomycetota bacterium]
MNKGIILEIPSQVEYLSLVRAVVASAASLDQTLGDQRIENLRLAVSEATTNAIRAHANLGSNERITIRFGLEGDRIEVEVQDHGSGFDPENLNPVGPLTETGRLEYEGGFGIPLMKILADEIKIESADEGTTVQLVVYVSPPSEDVDTASN